MQGYRPPSKVELLHGTACKRRETVLFVRNVEFHKLQHRFELGEKHLAGTRLDQIVSYKREEIDAARAREALAGADDKVRRIDELLKGLGLEG